mmetsp:Transcript_5912/g.10294  ORF Transcript_5912/g.10294 Transcript_5912/m.10294 type:complete len:324 (-) Transcript_5912:1027-1998(-)|eukprot:CAMPEP_0119110080 /NCGR_PEP_ID=MMETSP1180-20130426/26539_1 /TAXON_ID=3052 ORGANISM="Chlamydomonas cf sp, Strain CCMP681" /NCGR_SAMPLE_ID=MMETSP1180 /ASSEMBLY_ACC=CAM_ASM_000741 /LENGTH=323 /DNA_ID=CAMNT_0007096201 /DNA_START=151 /DNA_END=1122 /DNA_ORIENTATION=+
MSAAPPVGAVDVMKLLGGFAKGLHAEHAIRPAMMAGCSAAGWTGAWVNDTLDEVSKASRGTPKKASGAAASHKASGASEGTKKPRKKKGEEAEPSGRKPRPMASHNLFITIILDAVAKDPENPLYKRELIVDEQGNFEIGKDGKPKEKKGASMKVANGLWTNMSTEYREAFNKLMQPFLEEQNAALLMPGYTKPGNLLSSINDFLSHGEGSRQQLDDIIAGSKAAFAKAKAGGGGAVAAASGAAAPPVEKKRKTEPKAEVAAQVEHTKKAKTEEPPVAAVDEDEDDEDEDEDEEEDQPMGGQSKANLAEEDDEDEDDEDEEDE